MAETAYQEVDQDLMIDDLSYKDAHEYVMKFLTTEKKTDQQLKETQQELDKWNERLAFIEKSGDAKHLEQVKAHLSRLIGQRDSLKAEKEVLHRKNIILKEKLQAKPKDAEAAASARAERLLADFEQLVDVNEYKLDQAIKEQQAVDELEKLKARLANKSQ